MSIQQYLDKIKNAVYGREVRGAIHDAIKQTYDDASEGGDANMEVKMARGTFPNLKARLDTEYNQLSSQLAQTEQELDATANQVAQVQTDKADISYVDALMSNITDGSPKELFYSIGALNDKYPNGAVGPMLVFDASLEDGAHAFIWDGTEWVDTGVYQAEGIKDNSVTTSKLSDEITLKGYPFFNNATPPDEMRRAILDVKIYDADENKRYYIGTLQKNRNGETYSSRYRIMIYDTPGGNVVSTFFEDNYIPTSSIDTVKLTGVLNAEVTIEWSKLPDETSLLGMTHDVTGLHPLTYINQKDIESIENRVSEWEAFLTTANEEWVI